MVQQSTSITHIRERRRVRRSAKYSVLEQFQFRISQNENVLLGDFEKKSSKLYIRISKFLPL
ncbi:MAG: hypothetical protein CMR00_01400 [[Chlorobium] sp. 445]|nr:MAG: hypothetical protein CMR00_01400 [[Chlorobium] sp. 445]